MIKQVNFPLGGSPYQILGVSFNKPIHYYLAIVLLMCVFAGIFYFIYHALITLANNIDKKKSNNGQDPVPPTGVPSN